MSYVSLYLERMHCFVPRFRSLGAAIAVPWSLNQEGDVGPFYPMNDVIDVIDVRRWRWCDYDNHRCLLRAVAVRLVCSTTSF